jgi:hypothetical protein
MLQGAHVEVAFTDNTQLVTFRADGLAGDVAVSVSNEPAPAPTTTMGTQPPTIATAATVPATTPAPMPAAPAPTGTVHKSHNPTPPKAATSSPSSTGEDDSHEGSDD